jgi:hypothetical protein
MNNKIKILTKQMLLTKRKEKEAKRKEKNTTTTVTFYYDSTRTFGNDIVMLKVYDISGREVQTLVNESLQPGTYEVTFDGSGLNSGVYFYRLTAGNFSESG